MGTRLMWLRKLGTALVIVVVLAIVVALAAVIAAARSVQQGRGAQQGARPPVVASVWQTLEAKPLRLSQLAPGQVCAATQARQSVSPDYVVAVGNGPVYVVGGADTGVFTYTPANLFNASLGINAPATSVPAKLGGAKTRWQIAPGYTGPVLIRGRQLDGPNQLYFNGGLDQPNGNALGTEPVLSQLRLMGGGAVAPSWPTWVTLTRLASPGCYAYQVDGLSFSYSITFRAVSEVG